MSMHTAFRRAIPHGAAVILAAALCLVAQPGALSAQPPTPPAPVAPAAEPVVLTGTLVIVWGDPAPGSAQAGRTLYRLLVDDGQPVQLVLDEAPAGLCENLLDLNQRRVTVRGRSEGEPSRAAGPSVVVVQAIEPLPAPGTRAATAVTGSQPWVSLLCRFADVPDEPRSLPYFQGMYAGTFPGEDHYWREVSYGAIDLLGSTAVGWYTLPQPWSYYVYDPDGDGEVNLDHARAALDCIAAADADVYFPNYVGINLMFNANLDCCAWGGGWYLELDGVSRGYHMTWEPPWGYENVAIISHEMGHGFGLPHSSGSYGAVYDNQWDVMSDAWANCWNATDPTYGCVGQDTIAHHLDRLGWIPAGRKAVVQAGEEVSITLEQIDQPQTGNHLMAQLPIGNSLTDLLTVEARRKVGYDWKLPGQGVIIHEVVAGRPEPAHVVDADGNGNTGDAGAIWSVGETFIHPGSGISVRVDSATPTGWVVTLFNPPINEIVVDSTAQAPGGTGDCTLGEAIQAANRDAAIDGCSAGRGVDRIVVPAGTYVLTQVRNSADGNNGLPDVTSAVVLAGAGRDSTTIQRQAGVSPFRILHVGSAGSLEASGLAFSGGDAGANDGGAVYAAGNLTLSDSAVRDSRANRGGGLYLAPGVTAIISSTEITGNASANDGGSVFSEGTATIEGCTIAHNTSDANAAGVQNWLGMLALSSSVLENNVARNHGSGVLGLGGVTSIDGCLFAGNPGYPIMDNSGTLEIANTTLRSDAGDYALGISCWYCVLSIDGAQLYDNAAGAIFAFSDEPLSVNNSCIAGNGDLSVNNTGGALMNAVQNWWGDASGPSGAGGGNGDSVSTNVAYVPFLEEMPAFCGVAAPTAEFSGTPVSGLAPLEVRFANTSSGEVDTCSWDFGDGGTSDDCDDPAYTYDQAGSYDVSLTVTGPGGSNTLTRPDYVTVAEPVLAAFLGSPTSGVAPLLVTFTNQSTGDYDDDSCAWTFGDSGTSSDCDPVYEYAQTGTFTVSLSVSGMGLTDTLTRPSYVTVYEKVSADFACGPLTGSAPLAVTCTNLSTGDYDTCAWRFGDGGTSSNCGGVAHTFTAAGTYAVELTVSGPGGTATAGQPGYVAVLPVYRLYLPLTIRELSSARAPAAPAP